VKLLPRACLCAAATAALLAQHPSDPTELLVKARDLIVARAKRLPDYTCVQTAARQYFKHLQPLVPLPYCVQIATLNKDNPHDLALQATDRLRLDLKVSQGTEIGAWAGASQFSSRSVFDLIGEGSYGTGTLGSFLADIFQDGGATYTSRGQETAGVLQLTAHAYRVPLSSSHYLIEAGAGWAKAAFSGVFWVDSASAELRRLLVDANEIPPETGACEVATTVEYKGVKVGAGEFLLPIRSSMRTVGMDTTETRTTAVYSGCREYRGEASIRFDDAVPRAAAQAAIPAAPLAPGVSLSLALTSPINTDIAVAGDVVTAKLRKPVRVSKEVLIPAGATVEGRIVQMRHWLDPPPHFTISLLLETLQVRGVAIPLYARLRPAESANIALPPIGQSPLVAALLFNTDKSRYIVAAGYQSNWVTVEPPMEEKKFYTVCGYELSKMCARFVGRTKQHLPALRLSCVKASERTLDVYFGPSILLTGSQTEVSCL
jgi:hypothetical protein